MQAVQEQQQQTPGDQPSPKSVSDLPTPYWISGNVFIVVPGLLI